MENLAPLQRWLKWVITHPRGVEDALRTHESEPTPPYLKEIESIYGLNIYAEGYFSRLVEVLSEDFEHLHLAMNEIFGEMGFKTMVSSYLKTHPSRTKTISAVGEFLPEFLKSYEPLEEYPYLWEIAQMDWCATRAIYSTSLPLFNSSSLHSKREEDWEGLRFKLDPTVQFFRASHTIDKIWTKSKFELETIEKRPTILLIHRKSEMISIEKISSIQHEILEKMVEGNTLGKICEDLDETTPVMEWFSQWTGSGVIREVYS